MRHDVEGLAIDDHSGIVADRTRFQRDFADGFDSGARCYLFVFDFKKRDSINLLIVLPRDAGGAVGDGESIGFLARKISERVTIVLRRAVRPLISRAYFNDALGHGCRGVGDIE